MSRVTPDRYEAVAAAVRWLAWLELVGGAAGASAVVLDAEPWRRGFLLLWSAVTIPTVWALLMVGAYAIELAVEGLDELRDRRD